MASDVWAGKIEADSDGILHKSAFVEIAHRQNGKEMLKIRGCSVQGRRNGMLGAYSDCNGRCLTKLASVRSEDRRLVKIKWRIGHRRVELKSFQII